MHLCSVLEVNRIFGFRCLKVLSFCKGSCRFQAVAYSCAILKIKFLLFMDVHYYLYFILLLDYGYKFCNLFGELVSMGLLKVSCMLLF